MKKILKVVLSITLIIVVLFGIGIFLLYKNANSLLIGSGTVSDYDQRINIWNTVAGNSPQSKLDDMNIDYDGNIAKYTALFVGNIVGDEYKDVEKNLDTYTYLYEIKGSYEKETYEDEPYLIPYLVENSDTAVIVIPGGGYCYKSMDGTDGEGKDVAKKLNENGINAFVLHYRSNPYEYPIPELDLQRAIRYLRFHSEKYHLDKNKISAVGYSAGGNLVCTYINTIQGKDLFPDDYVKDEVDNESDIITYVSMIYPAITYNDNVNMLFAQFDDDDVRNDVKRKELLELTDNILNFNSNDIKQFVSYGTKDEMVGTEETKRYIEKAKEENTDIKVVVADGGSHGFQQKYYINEYIQWLLMRQ